MKSAYVLSHASIHISVAVLLTISVSANELSAMKGGVDNNPPCQCHDVIFETSWQEVANQLLDAAIPRIHALTEDEDERSALEEAFLSYGPDALNKFVLEGFFRGPLESLPMECRGAAKLVIFKHYLKFQTDGVLRDFASEWKGNNQDNKSTSADVRDERIQADRRDDFRDEEIQVMQKVEVGLGEVLRSELLARFNECLQKAFAEDAQVSIKALLSINDSDKVLTEDEVHTISEIVGEARSKVWWRRVSCPTVNVSELKSDSQRKVSLELKGKVSDRALSFAEELLLSTEESGGAIIKSNKEGQAPVKGPN